MTLQNKLNKIRQETLQEVKLMIDHSFVIVDRIDEIMRQKGISQKVLADRLGKRESEVSKWMRGTHNFTIKTIAKLEIALEEPILQFVFVKPSVFVMSVKNGHSVTHCAIHGVKADFSKNSSIYLTTNESMTISETFMEQLN